MSKNRLYELWGLLTVSVFVSSNVLAEDKGHSDPIPDSRAEVSSTPANKIAYTCKGEELTVRQCTERSTLKVKDKNFCVGPQITLSMKKFKKKLRHNLYTVFRYDTAFLDSLGGGLSREDLAKAREYLRLQLAKNEPESLGAETAYRKLNQVTNAALSKVCPKKSFFLPERESFLEKMFSDLDPSLGSCEQNCGPVIKLKNGNVVGQVVKRIVDSDFQRFEYIKDKTHTDSKKQLIWGPLVSNESLEKAWVGTTRAEAQAFCEAKSDFGLKWRLPTKEELLEAFRAPDETQNHLRNDHLAEALGMVNEIIWSSSTDGQQAWAYLGKSWRGDVEKTKLNIESNKGTPHEYVDTGMGFRCVAEDTES